MYWNCLGDMVKARRSRMKQKRRKCVFNSFSVFELWVKKRRGGGIGQLIRLMTWRLQVRILSPHAQWVRTQPLYLSTLMQSVKYGVSASIYISRTYENCKTKLGKGILRVLWVKGVPFVWGSWKSWLWLIPFLRDVCGKKAFYAAMWQKERLFEICLP